MAKLTLFRLKTPMESGKYRVYIRLSHKHQKIQRKTAFVCEAKDTNDDLILRSPKIIYAIYESFYKDWQDKLDSLEESGRVESMTADEILTYISSKYSGVPDIAKIDFLQFCREYADEALKEGRRKSSIAYMTVVNSLMDYAGTKIYLNDLTTILIDGYVRYLKQKHKTVRLNHGKKVTVERNGLNNQSINNRIKDFKTLFNAMKKKYSDPLTGEEYIRTNPFKFWKPLMVSNSGGYRATDVETIRLLNGLNYLNDSERFARDMFILSFCLLGINATDLYDLKVSDYKDGRISYNRNKTKGRRPDEAFISVEVLPVAEKILKQYLPKRPLSLLDLSEKYSGVDNLSRAINKGLKSLYLRDLGIPKLTYYSARHTWATIARNECGISREDIDAALNHTSENLSMADKYIKKDFSANDRNNRKVLEYVFG